MVPLYGGSSYPLWAARSLGRGHIAPTSCSRVVGIGLSGLWWELTPGRDFHTVVGMIVRSSKGLGGI